MFSEGLKKIYHGKCFKNKEAKKIFVEIPKCASKTFSAPLLWRKHYEDGNWNRDRELLDYEAFAVIRNPFERWRKSTVEMGYHAYEASIRSPDPLGEVYKHLVERDFYSDFDDLENTDIHHAPQYCFLEGLKDENLTICRLEDANVKSKFNLFFDIDFDYDDENVTDTIAVKKEILIWVDEILTQKRFVDKIMKYYEKDFELWKKYESKVN